MPIGQGTSGVQSVGRAFDILEVMSTVGGSISVTALADKTELPIPTIHRLIRTLVGRGYVRQLPSRHYALGPQLIRLGESATQLFGAWSLPHLLELVECTGETANMAILDDSMAVYVAQVPSPHSMRMFTEVGGRVFPHCTGVGKALLLQLPDTSIRAMLHRSGLQPYTENSVTDAEMLIGELHMSRQRGYATDDGEQELGVRCFSVPVIDAPIPTAISISGPAARVTIQSAKEIVPHLQRVASMLTDEFKRISK
ncbi:IclR family transcriptional regulator [Rhodococcus pseudokoreensis]|uniref:IclR family transcriptional regulator n=1 Tax=Rhodococcus pseudokoreensis TaxID=2811421 RepID=A0A974ZYU6_9NOCA|nr:IclR family transcriptional regulator [Rhodococcus pseudokoreensis]QSE95484.1 IclR family transcriptional regulator [Rhodococcus pseudokoreensis]